MRVFRTAFAASVLLGSAAIASADIAYNNFGAGFTFGSGHWNVGNPTAFPTRHVEQAFQFTAGASGDITAIYVALSAVTNGDATGSTPTFDLYSDNGSDQLGSLISTWGGSTPSAAAVQTLTGGSATLTLGTKYWLLAREPDPSKLYGWMTNGTSTSGIRGQSIDGGASFGYQSDVQGAFRIDVNPTSVPEPFTMALMGGSALAGYRRLRKQRA